MAEEKARKGEEDRGSELVGEKAEASAQVGDDQKDHRWDNVVTPGTIGIRSSTKLGGN